LKGNILYISYDGLLEPLGQSQVLAYLKPLADTYHITLISYEKISDWNNENVRNNVQKDIEDSGIEWLPLRYHKRPTAIATSYDIFIGMIVSAWITLRRGINIIHARSYVPSIIALIFQKVFKVKYIFDMRGFWADERVDGKLWQRDSKLYKIAKWFEKQFLINADVIVSLTHNAFLTIKGFAYLRNKEKRIQVIPTCVDLNIFKYSDNHENNVLDLDDRFVVGYVGSAGTWYLFDEVLACFKAIKSIIPHAYLLILNKYDHRMIRSKLEENNIIHKDHKLLAVNYSDVPKYISNMNCGLLFYKPTYSKKATSPTKMGEYLACGVPIIANDMGDVGKIIRDNRVGLIVNKFNADSYKDTIDELMILMGDEELYDRCRHTAEDYYSLEKGVYKYLEIYEGLLI
jgi:glycosyltransferase involved in cell wall biosynthesis